MISFAGSDWNDVKNHLGSKISEDLEALKNPKIKHDETQYYRGRIAAMEDLIDLQNRPEELRKLS